MTEDARDSARFNVSPRARVVYLLGTTLALFFLRSWWAVLGVTAVQVALWFAVGLPGRQLLRQVTRMWGLMLFILVSYALTSVDPAVDHWVALPLGAVSFGVNVGGVVDGALMVLRIILLVVASQVARAGDPRAIAAGLTALHLPRMFAISIDAVLSLLGEEGGRGGGGGGGGGGRRRRQEQDGDKPPAEPTESLWASMRRLGSGDVAPFIGRLERQIARADAYAREHEKPNEARGHSGDVAIIAGVALTMLSIKMVKVLPSLPFAPGHKMIVLLPLYVVAARLTRGRFGATYTGLTMGTVAFLMGDGRYGIFEILKHVTPGILCDLLLPVLMVGGRMPGRLAWSLFGSVIGIGRFATVFAIVLVAQPPAVAYAILLPGLATDIVFGFLSGYVTFHVVRAMERVRGEMDDRKKETAWAS